MSDASQPDPATIRSEIESCAGSHRALADRLHTLDAPDPAAPSLLPGWTLGHVLTHIARNGDSHLDMLAGRPQYPSVESRNADIESGARRGWAELVDDVIRSGDAVDAAFAAVDDWTGQARTIAGDRPRSMLPLLRQREVEIHRIDLGLGDRFDDLPGDYVRRELRVLSMLWTARQPMGLTALPEPVLAAAPAARLAWFVGRGEIDGVGPAEVF